MKEFIEKLIGRLEEKFKYNSEQAEIYRDGSDKDAYFREKKDLYMDRANTYGQVMRIVNQLAEEYKDAEEQGELVLYPTNAYFIMNNKIYEGWVQEAVYSVCRKPIFDIRYDDNSLNSYSGYLGNTVFLTKAEAEQALKQMGE